MLFLLFACGGGGTVDVYSCTIPAPEDATGIAGESVDIVADHAFSVNDTVVSVGSETADVLYVDRDSCDECDSCMDDAACGACGDCDACAVECAPCVQTVTVRVPDVEPGDYAVIVSTASGTSLPGNLTVE